MNHHFLSLLVVLTCLLGVGQACVAQDEAEDSPVKIGLIGDSTVASMYGWGPALAERINDRGEVLNYAKNGATLMSLSKQLDELIAQQPDYILIQFGHNDMKRYDTEAYGERLTDYVERIKAAGITPIVLSSVTRRTFGKDGKIVSTAIDGRTLTEYARAAGAVAEEQGVGFIDLHTISIAHHNEIGPEASAAYNFEETDSTHFSPFGAAATAALIIPELIRVAPRLEAVIEDQAPADGQGQE